MLSEQEAARLGIADVNGASRIVNDMRAAVSQIIDNMGLTRDQIPDLEAQVRELQSRIADLRTRSVALPDQVGTTGDRAEALQRMIDRADYDLAVTQTSEWADAVDNALASLAQAQDVAAGREPKNFHDYFKSSNVPLRKFAPIERSYATASRLYR
jgi:septal ring factor EnvC (AmiA/AmiB activator)